MRIFPAKLNPPEIALNKPQRSFKSNHAKNTVKTD